MNWLAHVFLSKPSADFRLGNLLADLVRGADRERMPPGFLQGAAAHKAIDAFTDAHPVVRRTRARLDPSYRRFSGVLVDIFYDYCLAQRWERFATQPLTHFTSEFYSQIEHRPLDLPSDARVTLERIVRHDLLGQYARVAGVENSLRRVSTYLSQRWRREFRLEASVAELIAHEADILMDFDEFFPQLHEHAFAVVAEMDQS